jgi:hypothetical protein
MFAFLDKLVKLLIEKLSSLEPIDLTNNNNNNNVDNDCTDKSNIDEYDELSFSKFLSEINTLLETASSCYATLKQTLETTHRRDIEYTSLVLSKLQIARAENK